MSSEYYEVRPKSIEDIRSYTTKLREMLILKPEDSINFLFYLDIMTFMFKEYNFEYIVLEDDNRIFKEKDEAHTNIKTGTIYIKESVFANLSVPSSRSNFTIPHELGHFFLHYLNGPVLSRNTKPEKVYENPEWQANQFAAELLMPYEVVKNLSIEEIYLKYNVSYQAAKNRYERINKKRF